MGDDPSIAELENLLKDLEGRNSIAPANVNSRKMGAKSTFEPQNITDLDDMINSLGISPSRGSFQASAQVQPQRAQVPSVQYGNAQPQRAQAGPPRNRDTIDTIDGLLETLSNQSPSHSSPNNRPPTTAYKPAQPQTAQVAYAGNGAQNNNYNPPVQRLSVAPQSSTKVFVAKPPSVRPIHGDDLNNLLDHLTSSSAITPSSPNARGSCVACGRHILGEVISAMGSTYHPEHFICGNCRNPLGTQSYFEQDGVPHCEKCYHELLCARCAHCDEPIKDRCITALGRKWHQHHFICTQCLHPFGNGSFFERDGRPYCQNCFSGNFAPRCVACSQPIHGECTNALGQTWHATCFVCQHCHQAFRGSFYEHNGKPYCDVHYHQQTGSLCSGCNKAVTGRVIDALGKKWHPEHFVCGFCMNPLTTGNYIETGGKAYCRDCNGKLFG